LPARSNSMRVRSMSPEIKIQLIDDHSKTNFAGLGAAIDEVDVIKHEKVRRFSHDEQNYEEHSL
jgi:hypothetical protein